MSEDRCPICGRHQRVWADEPCPRTIANDHDAVVSCKAIGYDRIAPALSAERTARERESREVERLTEQEREIEALLGLAAGGIGLPLSEHVRREVAARVEAEREMGVAHAFRDKHLDSLRACMEKREAQVAALENVRALAAQAKVYGWKPDHADHMLRFCAEAGVVSSPLRAALGAEPGDAALGEVARLRGLLTAARKFGAPPRDHACDECVPHSDMLVSGFKCWFHAPLNPDAALTQKEGQGAPAARSPEYERLLQQAVQQRQEEQERMAAMTPEERDRYIDEWAARMAPVLMEDGCAIDRALSGHEVAAPSGAPSPSNPSPIAADKGEVK